MTDQPQNQRQFFRLPISMEIKFKILRPGEEDLDILFLNSHNGMVIDLSGGGAVIESKVFTEPGTLLKIKLSIPGEHVSPFEAAVIRTDHLPAGGYKTAVKFTNITDGDVKKILNYLNQILIRQNRKKQ